MYKETIRKEACRKAIHLLGLGYIPLYLVVGKEYTLLVVVALTIFAAFLEILRIRYSIFPRWILRNYEKKGIGAYLYFGISATLITVLLPMEACFAGIVVGSLGDGVAGLIKQTKWKKYAPVAMFASSTLLLVALSHLVSMSIPSSFVSAIAGTVIERFPKIGKYYINDNLSVPLISAIFYHLTSLF